MPAFILRLAVFCALVVVAALVAPIFAPDLLASFFPSERAATATPAPALPSPSPARVMIDADGRGHFVADAVINGRTVRMVVDTGATVVALNAATAGRLGIHPARADFTQPIATANGIVAGAAVTLSEIRLGNVTVRDVRAVVVAGDAPAQNLLGMSFLGRLAKFESGGGRLVLVQ